MAMATPMPHDTRGEIAAKSFSNEKKATALADNDTAAFDEIKLFIRTPNRFRIRMRLCHAPSGSPSDNDSLSGIFDRAATVGGSWPRTVEKVTLAPSSNPFIPPQHHSTDKRKIMKVM